MKPWQKTLIALAIPFGIGMIPPVHAQEPTRLMVPYGAGGSTDIAARLIAEKLSERWAKPVIVENRPGASGTIASRYLTNSKPDGNTLLIVTSAHAINEVLYDQLPYRTRSDFTPIAQVTSVPNVLLTSTDSPYKSVRDVIAAGRKDPEALAYGTAGAGTSVHLAGELFAALANIKMMPVHFKGDGESIAALIGGHIPLSFNTVSGAKAQILAGKVRALAVTGTGRVSTFGDVPTISESGLPDYAVSNWGGILGPANMDSQKVAGLNADLRAILSEQSTIEKFNASAMYIQTGSPADFDQLIQRDIEKWDKVLSNIGLKGSKK